MIEIGVFDLEGNETGKMLLSEEVFGVNVNPEVIHEEVVNQLARKRMGTACAKTRSEVRGGGRKPFRQKGTGSARAGTIRSPLWRGGGVVFGPKPRKYGSVTPKKIKKLVLKGVLSSKVSEGAMMVMDQFKLSQPKSKELNSILKKFSCKKPLLITEDKDVIRAARNISYVKITSPQELNTYDLLDCDKIFMTKDVIANIESKMKGSEEK